MATQISTVHLHAGRLVLLDSTLGAIPVAELSDLTVESATETKDLPSDNQVAAFSIRTGQKVSIKAKVARVLSARMHGAMFGGTVATSGVKAVVDRESHDAAGTVVASATTDFVSDLGVFDKDGIPMTPVASAPAVGQYIAGAAGVGSYTFNVAQTGKVYLCFVKSGATGEVVTVDQQAQAEAPVTAMWCWNSTKQPDGTTKQNVRYFYKVVPTKLSEGAKQGDFTGSDVEFEAKANSAGKFWEAHNT